MTWIITGFSLVAVVLNIRRNRACFWIWTLTNGAWAAVDWSAGIYAQATLHLVYLCLALYGVHAWSRGEHHGGEAST